MTALRRLVRFATFALALGGSSALTTAAQADGRACNPPNATEAKWIALTKGDASCSQTTARQQSWFLVHPGECVTMFTHSAAGRLYWYYSEGFHTGTSTSFPALSSTSSRWKEQYNAGFGGLDSGTCFDTAQNFICSNPGVTCAVRPHFPLGAISSTRLDIGL